MPVDIPVDECVGDEKKACHETLPRLRARAEQILTDTAPHAASYLHFISKGAVDKPNATRVDVCKYVLNQALGMPTQKQVIAGEVVFKVVYDTPDTSSREVIKPEGGILALPAGNKPSVVDAQAQVMSADQLKQIGQSLGDAVHE